ncbi:MAG: ParB N-terminal domain-containing protein [Cypionkella sp.]|uniref:ParB/RepB/Spo0J family partition protein n=1 Tax=Cypionkella sp. TaxID=2811411 RepID=UPI002AB920DB|nr:ParB N-terminal domain-containing protein [Cypionkella sp.]MDZ4311594.1 ParB N-terminal domain-containing protein [Cypionkella sp.]
MTPHILIPIIEIDAEALPRDRTQLDEDAMAELTTSIATTGLRMPIEVWKLSQPTETHRYGLISGLRRLTAHQRLATLRQNGSFTEIAAFLRTPETIPAAMADMVAENEIRAETSAWEKGATLLAATRAGIFDTLDDATQTLHASASRQKRARLRAFAEVVEDLQDAIVTPERLTGRQMHRLSAALRAGLSELIHLTLRDHRRSALPTQWQALLPILSESLDPTEEATATTPGRPRRLLQLKQGLTIRREKSGDGWIMRFCGPEARSGALIDDVMDHIERYFQPH